MQKNKKTFLKSCVVCGCLFVSNHPKRKYCSEQCKIKQTESLVRSNYTVFQRDNFKCVYCGRSPIEDGVKLCLDHIEPYYISKNNSLYNLVTSCTECNIGKNKRTLSSEVYKRIIKRNIELNKGITKEQKIHTEIILNKMFTMSKKYNKN